MKAVALATVDPSLSGTMYIGSDGKAPLYFADTDDSGTSYVLNVISSESFSITEVITGDSLLVDGTGLHVYTGGCDLAMDIFVGSFFEQVRHLSKRHAPLFEETHGLEKRGQDPFDVSVSIKNQCGQLTPLDPVPEVFLGPSECSFVRGQGGVYNFTCNYPGEESLAAICELYINEGASWLSTLVILAGLVAQFVPQARGALAAYEALASLARLLASFTTQLGKITTLTAAAYKLLERLDTTMSRVNAVIGIESLCTQMFPFGTEPLNFTSGESVVKVLRQITELPTSLVSETVTIRDPDAICPTGRPPCSGPGSCAAGYPSCGVATGCVCGSSVNGGTGCVRRQLCGVLRSCWDDGDCGLNQMCTANTCCTFAPGVCIDWMTCNAPSRRDIGANLFKRSEDITQLWTDGWH